MNISKISYGVLPRVLDNYIVLNSGGALGEGVGPLLIASSPKQPEPSIIETLTVAIPGEQTTAHMLFSMAFPKAKKKSFLVFNQIENAVQIGKADLGVIIHENRFTYQDKGLYKVMDLGEYWEKQTGLPIPLGGIVAQRNLQPEIINTIDKLIKESVEYSFKHYPTLSPYITMHAQEMSEDVMRKHIDLYVNDFSIDLGINGKKSVEKLLQVMNYEANSEIFTI